MSTRFSRIRVAYAGEALYHAKQLLGDDDPTRIIPALERDLDVACREHVAEMEKEAST